MFTLTCCCRLSRIKWREQSIAALNVAMLYTLLVNLVHTQCVHMLIVLSTYYVFCVHNILLPLSFSTQSYSLAGIVALPTYIVLTCTMSSFSHVHTVCWGPSNLLDQHHRGISMLVLWLSHYLRHFFLPGSHVTMGKYRNLLYPWLQGCIMIFSKKSHEIHQWCLWNYGFPWHKSVNNCMRLLNKHVLCTWGETFNALLVYLHITGTFFTFCTLFDLYIKTEFYQANNFLILYTLSLCVTWTVSIVWQ